MPAGFTAALAELPAKTKSMRMTQRIATALGMLLLAGGCGNDLYPPTSGDFVRTSSGLGEAQAWGIDFEIKNTGGGGARVSVSGGRSLDPEKTDARKEITLGQYAIVLEKVPGSPITLTINDQKYGSVEIGDSIRIARKVVRVNGVVREPQSDEATDSEEADTEAAGGDDSAGEAADSPQQSPKSG